MDKNVASGTLIIMYCANHDSIKVYITLSINKAYFIGLEPDHVRQTFLRVA